MTKFNLSKDEIKKLDSYISHGKDLANTSKYIFSPKDDKLYIAMMGNAFSVRITLDITNLETDKDPSELNYFFGDLLGIIANANKLIKDSESLTFQIDETGDSSCTSIINDELDTKISLTNYEPKSPQEAEEILNAFETDLQDKFNGNQYTITPTDEFMKLMDIICRSMRVSGNEVNSAMVNHNVVKYCDPQGILTYTLDTDVCPYDKDIIIQSSLIEYAKPLMKYGVTITLDETNQWAYIKATSFVMVLGLEENKFQFPTQDEEDYVSPSAGARTSISIDRQELLDGLTMFEGAFRSDLWKWANITLDSSKKYKSQNKIFLSHKDYNASVSTYVNMSVVEDNEVENEDFSFLIGSAYLKDILSIMKDDSVVISYTANEIGEPHGTGYMVEGEKLKVICVKIQKADA